VVYAAILVDWFADPVITAPAGFNAVQSGLIGSVDGGWLRSQIGVLSTPGATDAFLLGRWRGGRIRTFITTGPIRD
jgi:hypothetical protein